VYLSPLEEEHLGIVFKKGLGFWGMSLHFPYLEVVCSSYSEKEMEKKRTRVESFKKLLIHIE